MVRKKILYYAMYGTGGGSDHSLLNLIKFLDTNKYEPFVYAKMDSFFTLLLEEYGAEVIIGNESKGGKKYLEESNGIKSLKRRTSFIRKTKIFYYLYSTPKMVLNALPKAYKIYKLLRNNSIDIVHLNNSLSSNRSALIAGLAARVEIVAHYRGLSKPEKFDVFLSRFVKKIICISEFVRNDYISHGIAPDKCVVIYNGVDTSHFTVRQNSKNRELVIANIGRLEEWKGQRIFIEAAAGLLKENNDLKFLIVGSGSKEKELKQQTEELKIENKVEFKGFVEDISILLEEIDILVHTAIEPEPFGRVIIEGMAAGLPVIATNIGGPKEIIEDGKDGILIVPNNPSELVKKLRVLINDKNFINKLKGSAITKVNEYFDIVKTTSGIEKVYENLCE